MVTISMCVECDERIRFYKRGVKMMLYGLLTGPDDSEFCRRVSQRLKEGWSLYGSPSVTFNGVSVIAAQALVKEVPDEVELH